MSANGRKLFLGGLTKTTTTEQLFEIFGRFGQVVDAVVMERNGAPRGFGFVTFKDKSSINEVLAKGVTIDGREVDVKRAVPEEEMAFAPSKVFVGGLSQKVDKAALKAHFDQFGDVRDAVVMIDRATSRSRGFGFVRFSTPEAVARVLAQPQMIDGQYVDVKRAEPADSLPPPQYPRTRGEEDEGRGNQRRRRRGKRGGPGSGTVTPKEDPTAAPDALDFNALSSANLAMWSLLSLGGVPPMQQQQVSSSSQAPVGQHAFGFPPIGFPGASSPAGFPDMSSLFANAGVPPTPSFEAPSRGKPETPFGDLSNVLSALDQNKAHPSPEKSRAVSPPLPVFKSSNGVDLSSMLGPENKPGLAFAEMKKSMAM